MRRILTTAALVVLLFCAPASTEAAFGEWFGVHPVSSVIPPPVPLSPADGAVLTTNVVTLEWENQSPATSYHLQVDDSPDFTSPELEYRELFEKRKTVTLPSDGTWYWRVRLFRQTPGAPPGVYAWSPYSEVRRFTVATGGVQLAPTTITLDPGVLELFSGSSQTITATLTSGGAPLAGRTLRWSATGGELSETATTTDESGRASVRFTAPATETELRLALTVSFDGDAEHAPASARLEITVFPPVRVVDYTRNLEQTLARLQSTLENLLAGAEGLDRHVENLRLALETERVAAVVDIAPENVEHIAAHPEVRVSVSVFEPGRRVELKLDSEGPGRTLVLNLEAGVLPVDLVVLLDGEPVPLASGLEDVLDPTDENRAEHLIAAGTGGMQVLVSIPSFSVRTVTLAVREELPLALLAAGAAVALLIAALGLKRRGGAPREAEAQRVCPSCGRANSPQAQFCGYCGRRLEPEQPREPAPAEPERPAEPVAPGPAERPAETAPPERPPEERPPPEQPGEERQEPGPRPS
jgi:hypothetical protein